MEDLMDGTIRWGIASTGNISTRMTETLRELDGAEVVAVGSRTQESADRFAARHGIARAHGSYDDLWADDGVDVVYIGTPHSEHHAMTIAALDAGRHVLCEKAFARNRGEAAEMIEAARRNDRFLMEAMWSWFMPAWIDLRERIRRGVVGEVVTVTANFCIERRDVDGRLRRPDLAGGALLDIGIYPLALGRFLLGEPEDVGRDVRALATLTDQGVDETVAGVVRHAGGALTSFTSSIEAFSDRGATIVGTEGTITVPAPFWCPSGFTIERNGEEPETVEMENRGDAHEAEHTMACLRAGRIESDVQTWAATMANMELMDEIRRQVGVVYPGE